MKNVFVLAKRQPKYEGTRTLIGKIVDNWEVVEEFARTLLAQCHDLLGGSHHDAAVLWPLAALITTLCEWEESDDEDQLVGVAHYLYQLWAVRAIVKHLTDPYWTAVRPYLEEHFWYGVGLYRNSTPASARKQLEIKLELSPLGFSDFVKIIE